VRAAATVCDHVIITHKSLQTANKLVDIVHSYQKRIHTPQHTRPDDAVMLHTNT